jgi:putative ABC transport system substrate-binding protein
LKRRDAIFACAGVATPWAARVQAQPAAGSRRLGVLLFDRPDVWRWFVNEVVEALARLGWREGVNLRIDWRYAQGDQDQLAPLARSLADSGAHAILTRGTPATRACRVATSSVPIVTGVGDPIGSGFAASLARPGGNITGLSFAHVELSRKRLELMREWLPQLKRLTVIYPLNLASQADEAVRPLRDAAQATGIATRLALVGSGHDLRQAIGRRDPESAQAAYLFNLAAIEPDAIAQTALQAGMPSFFGAREFVMAGGLMSYDLRWDDQTRRTAEQIDQLFRGAQAAQMPFELPTRSELVINARTAAALSLHVPRLLRLRADEVIQ